MTRRLSLTSRLALTVAAITIASLLAAGGVIGLMVDAHFEELDSARLAGAGRGLCERLTRLASRPEVGPAWEEVRKGLDDGDDYAVALFDANGQALHVTSNIDFATVRRHADAIRAVRGRAPASFVWPGDGREYRAMAMRAPTAIPDTPYVFVALTLDMGMHSRFMEKFHQAIWICILLFGLVAGAMTWLAARRGMAPLRAIADKTRAIAVDRLGERLPVESVPSELASLAEAFNAMLAGLDASFHNLTNYSADIAHELRTPVGNLTTQTQVVLGQARTAAEYQELLRSNLCEYESMDRMISDMLLIAKVDNGLLASKREPVDLGGLLDALVERYRRPAEDKAVYLVRHGEGCVVGDAAMLKRAAANLVENAVRHTPRGGRISLVVEPLDDGGMRLIVENTGSAIAPEHLPRLFDRFYRGGQQNGCDGTGTGIGLAIVKSIAQAHGGSVSVSSANGVTAFVLALPPSAGMAPPTRQTAAVGRWD